MLNLSRAVTSLLKFQCVYNYYRVKESEVRTCFDNTNFGSRRRGDEELLKASESTTQLLSDTVCVPPEQFRCLDLSCRTSADRAGLATVVQIGGPENVWKGTPRAVMAHGHKLCGCLTHPRVEETEKPGRDL
ncbi:hypothetical protein NDU88_003658 [Pleurodeles waltl]|uniref:Uncharacterized protein n=1 Tax=Pleurodeles waltl TaxID=8319 RepID=A0AAV7M603_PLEWA|nr:hypothetical protein NDU88_003658 [Pleurodeles waltl]